MSEDDPLIGTLVAGRYRVGRRIGEGGMGVVYVAVHEALHKKVALKVLGATRRIDREAIARFEREGIAAANLKHPNIAEAMDFGQLPDGGFYLVMEYVEGTTLKRLLVEQGKLSPERALAILQQVASALVTAHARDVVHRDLKPDNVIVTSVPESSKGRATDVVKVIDFGIAKLRSATFGGGGTGLTSAGTVFGTPEYMSPEQVMGQAVDARADQYALGVLAFELFAGKPPYQADDVGQLMMMHVGAPVPSTHEQTPTLPPAIDSVTARMLAKLPDERFDSVADAMQALEAALGSGTPAPTSRAASVASAPSVAQTTLPSPKAAESAGAPASVRSSGGVGARLALGVGAASLVVGALIVLFVARSCATTATPSSSEVEVAAAAAESGGQPGDAAAAATAAPSARPPPATPAARAVPATTVAPQAPAAPPAGAVDPPGKGKGKSKGKK